MKKVVLFLASIALLCSCSDNGLNKPIIEPLSVDELKANMEDDSTFTEFYSHVQQLRQWIIQDDIRQAKYNEVTYKEIKNYIKHGSDTAYFNEFRESWYNDYNNVYPNYDSKIDSILDFWTGYKERYNMDSLVTIEYDRLWKEYYPYSGSIQDVNIGFRITPLKGKVDQLIFRYKMIPKINNDNPETSTSYYSRIWDMHRCVASTPIQNSTTLYWEADYSDKNILEGKTSEEVGRDYDFIIELVNIRKNGENFEEKLKLIPESVDFYFKYGRADDISEMYDYYKASIIKELINSDYKSYYEYTQSLIDAEMKAYDSIVYELINEYDRHDD